jgi:hypothetical protein
MFGGDGWCCRRHRRIAQMAYDYAHAYQAGGASWNGTRDRRNPVVISYFDSGLGSAVAGQSGSGRTIRTCSGSCRETPTNP